MGRLAIVQQENICINQSVAVLRPNEKILPEYLFYLLTTPEYQTKMIGDSDGTVIKHIYITRVGKMEVDIPSIEEQKERLKHLLALDGKIKLNSQNNQTLEQIAQAIFKSWFVDFEPVKAKIQAKQNGQDPERAAMCAISGKSLEELEQLSPETQQKLKTTAVLFPDALVESELGEIPEGWDLKLNGEVMDVRDGTHDSPKQTETGYPLVTSKHITTGALKIKDAYLISEENYEKVNKRSKVEQGDILLTMIGTVGYPYLVMQQVVNFAIKNCWLVSNI